jgi:murein endopeptidase
VDESYCRQGKHYVTPAARTLLIRLSGELSAERPGAVVRYMEASWPRGARPMPPHRSHGDGHEVDLALFYLGRDGRRLAKPPHAPGPPIAPGYGAYEPPQREGQRVCTGPGPHDRPDPPAWRTWRLDEAGTGDLIRKLVAEPGVRRVFVEPHLKDRLGFAHEAKVRFAGCVAARHDDHIHVDFR